MQIYHPGDCPGMLQAADGTVVFGIELDASFLASDWFALELSARGTDEIRLTLEWCANADSPALVRTSPTIIPNVRAVLPFPIDRANFKLSRHFLVPYSTLLKGGIGGVPTEKEQIHFVRVTLANSHLADVNVYRIFCAEKRPAADVRGDARVDRFGQGMQDEWAGKIHDEAELCAYLRAEYDAADSAGYPDGWSKWGGWTAKQFDATGWFRTEHDGRRWWLVDPDGNAFFSNGICYGERAGIFGFADEYASLFEWLPDESGEFADAWGTAADIPQYVVRNGADGADKRKMFNFTRANLIRVFGEHWHEAYTKITAARLKRMGFNTIGVGTNDYFTERTQEFLAQAKMPYVVTFRTFPLTKERIFRDFPDVYGEEYRTLCREFAERVLPAYKDDPYMIGYFVTNEPEWLFGWNINLCERLVSEPGCIATKREFIRRLRDTYADIAALNAAWGTALADFDALLGANPGIYGKTERATADFDAFQSVMIGMYGKVVSEELHRVDPHHLNLGMRYSGAAKRTMESDLSCFDVFSINCYSQTPRNRVEVFTVDMPVISGEWHFGAKESGLPGAGFWYVNTQKERAAACRYYMEDATQIAKLVGTHYFEYNDQPYFGRFDGECHNIGLVDVCQRPYPEVCGMFTDFAQRMYPMLCGDVPMTAEPVEVSHR